MKRIETFEELQTERRLSKLKIAWLESQIIEDIEEIKNSLQPVKIAGRVANDLFSSERSGLIGESIDLAVDTLIKKLLMRKSNWAMKLATTFFLKNYAKNIFSRNAEDILHWVKNKIKKTGNAPKTHHEAVMDEVNWDI